MQTKKGMLAKAICTALTISLLAGMLPQQAEAASTPDSIPVYHRIPAYQYKDIFEEERVSIQGIKVEEIIDDSTEPVTTQPIERSVTFTVFNSTKQEVEGTVQSENGMLPALNLIKDHNYILFAEDDQYWMRNTYLWVKDGKPVNIKCDPDLQPNREYPEITSIQMYDGSKKEKIAEAEKRIFMNLDVLYGAGNRYNVQFKLVSAVETIDVSSGDSGKLRAELLEDVTYTPVVESDEYTIDTFPLAGKDKSEYKYQNNKELGRYFYDHSSCKRVYELRLIDKADAHKNDTTVTSLSGDTTVTGYNFKDFLIMDRKLDKSQVDGLEGKDADVIDIKVVNPHRWEISKLAAGEFQITEKISEGKQVKSVAYEKADGELESLAFEQNGDAVSFTMNTMSMYPVVIEYSEAKKHLKEEIQNSENLDEGDYTTESWKILAEALAAGKEVLANKEVSEEEQESAVEAILKARNALELSETITPARKAALEAAVSEAEKISAGGYAAESYKALSDAIAAAKTLLSQEAANNAECKIAISKIEEAKKALKKAPVDVKISKVAINGISKKIAAGKKVQLTSAVTPSNASNKAVKWTSSNKKYATVSAAGKVTTKKAGAGKTVKITATAADGSGKSAVYQIKIMKHAVKSISLKAAKSIKAGKKLNVKTTVKTTGKSANKTLKWTSSNTKYATVNSKGKVIAKKAGKGKTVKITAQSTDGSGKKKTIKIKIK